MLILVKLDQGVMTEVLQMVLVIVSRFTDSDNELINILTDNCVQLGDLGS